MRSTPWAIWLLVLTPFPSPNKGKSTRDEDAIQSARLSASDQYFGTDGQQRKDFFNVLVVQMNAAT